MRIPKYIEGDTHLVKLQQKLAYAKNEDTFVYRHEFTFRKIAQILLSLCQIKDASVYS